MLDKSLCGRCLYRQFVQLFNDKTAERMDEKLSDEAKAKLKRLIPKRLRRHERQFSKWLKLMIRDSAGLMPCICHSERPARKLGSYEPLELLFYYVELNEPSDDCKFLLEHTLLKGDKKRKKK